MIISRKFSLFLHKSICLGYFDVIFCLEFHCMFDNERLRSDSSPRATDKGVLIRSLVFVCPLDNVCSNLSLIRPYQDFFY